MEAPARVPPDRPRTDHNPRPRAGRAQCDPSLPPSHLPALEAANQSAKAARRRAESALVDGHAALVLTKRGGDEMQRLSEGIKKCMTRVRRVFVHRGPAAARLALMPLAKDGACLARRGRGMGCAAVLSCLAPHRSATDITASCSPRSAARSASLPPPRCHVPPLTPSRPLPSPAPPSKRRRPALLPPQPRPRLPRRVRDSPRESAPRGASSPTAPAPSPRLDLTGPDLTPAPTPTRALTGTRQAALARYLGALESEADDFLRLRCGGGGTRSGAGGAGTGRGEVRGRTVEGGSALGRVVEREEEEEGLGA